MDKFEKYKSLDYTMPKTSSAWRIYGQGMDNFGDDKKSTTLPIEEPGDDELLVRNDAVGLCFSDTKIIKFGENHPRIAGRDMKKEPTIPGHEVALTVIKAGKNRADRYKRGDRYIIQADVKYKGAKIGWGYVLPGGLSQYCIITKEVLDGDEGSYLIPLENDDMGYSELALIEPWACVVAAYRIEHRKSIKEGGVLLIAGTGRDEKDWDFSGLFKGGTPGTVVVTGLGSGTMKKVQDTLQGRGPAIKEESGNDIRGLAGKYTEGRGFDDIVLLGDLDNETVAAAADSLNANGVLNYMASTDKEQTVPVDAGKIHYDVIGIIGSTGTDVAAPYTENADYHITGESVLMFGAGGPMGQMHIQLAMEQENPPKLVVATDIDDKRVETLKRKFGPLAKEKGITYRVFNPKGFDDPDKYRKEILGLNGGGLYDYVVCLAAIPAVIEEASTYLGDRCVLNIFAGVSKGTIANLNIKDVVSKAARYIGSSGSTIADMEYTLRKNEKGQLKTNNAVAGISGMNDVWRGIDAVRTGSFPGKIVVYPHIDNLDLTPLDELGKKLPKVAALLSKDGGWTREAEQELLNELTNIS